MPLGYSLNGVIPQLPIPPQQGGTGANTPSQAMVDLCPGFVFTTTAATTANPLSTIDFGADVYTLGNCIFSGFNNTLQSYTLLFGQSFGSSSNSVAICIGSTSNLYGAQMINSYVFGPHSLAQNVNQTIIGGTLVAGYHCTGFHSAQLVTGNYAIAWNIGERVHASGKSNREGDNQHGDIHLFGTTTNTTARILGAAGSTSNLLVLQDYQAITGTVRVSALDPATGDTGAWKFDFAAKRRGGVATTAIQGGTISPSPLNAIDSSRAWSVSFQADTANGSVNTIVTGDSATVQWACKVDFVRQIAGV